jgi:hypothetical protein
MTKLDLTNEEEVSLACRHTSISVINRTKNPEKNVLSDIRGACLIAVLVYWISPATMC